MTDPVPPDSPSPDDDYGVPPIPWGTPAGYQVYPTAGHQAPPGEYADEYMAAASSPLAPPQAPSNRRVSVVVGVTAVIAVIAVLLGITLTHGWTSRTALRSIDIHSPSQSDGGAWSPADSSASGSTSSSPASDQSLDSTLDSADCAVLIYAAGPPSKRTPEPLPADATQGSVALASSLKTLSSPNGASQAPTINVLTGRAVGQADNRGGPINLWYECIDGVSDVNLKSALDQLQDGFKSTSLDGTALGSDVHTKSHILAFVANQPGPSLAFALTGDGLTTSGGAADGTSGQGTQYGSVLLVWSNG